LDLDDFPRPPVAGDAPSSSPLLNLADLLLLFFVLGHGYDDLLLQETIKLKDMISINIQLKLDFFILDIIQK
jgi:hypothetical protein